MRSIVVRLAGGLGNQLFQFAALLKAQQLLSICNKSVFIDSRFLATYKAKHQFEIGFIVKYLSDYNISNSPKSVLSLSSRFRLSRILDVHIGRYAFVNSIDNLLSLSPDITDFVVIDGYFQHPSILFSDDQRIFLCEKLLSERPSLIHTVMTGQKTIGVHIRRGDYLSSNAAARVFRTISIDYYRAALDCFAKDRQILVFSDDRALSATFAQEVGGLDTRALNLTLADEFCLFVACENYVIANSTFSWWASYFGNSQNKIVISPKKWYLDEQRSQHNPLLLKHFQLLDY